MGYDLHVTRAEAWWDSEHDPITLDEWIEYVEACDDLAIEGFAELTTPDGSVIRLEQEGMAAWTGHPEQEGEPVWFSFPGDRIVVKSPDGPTIARMHEIAAALGGRVQGDDGEHYEADGTVVACDDPPEPPRGGGARILKLFRRR